MSIASKNWKVQHDKMPPGARLRVHGTVTVNHPGIEPVLVRRAAQNGSTTVTLDLELQRKEGAFVQVVCDKAVRFEESILDTVSQVEIFHDGQLLASITDILITH
ncbi:hypothetical protein ACLEJW_07135 [Pseudomonas sp. SMSB3]|uniref:hypothetical protein n=1 Tax=unclassified Pseudomonas TaxID=196821 RepID=UPI0011A6301E|nr:hypothetical protein [Pseudomonas sp. URMO17WK12:I11]